MSPTVKKLIASLKRSKLSTADRTALIGAIMNKLVVPPIKDIIREDGMSITIGGRELEGQDMVDFKLSLVALTENPARKVLRDQLSYEAVKIGIHSSKTVDELMFAKAVLWVLEQEELLIAKFSTIS